MDRHPGGHHPDHRHQCRHHRRVATGVLHGPAPPDSAGPGSRASQAAHAVCLDHLLRRCRVRAHRPPGSTRAAGGPVCLRCHDLVHHRAPLGGRAALSRSRIWRGRGARRSTSVHGASCCRCTAIIGGLGTFTVWCVVVATHSWGRIIGFSWMAVGICTYVIYRRGRAIR